MTNSKYLCLWKFTYLAMYTYVSTSHRELCFICVLNLHRWLHSRYIFLYLVFYTQDLFWIVLHVGVCWARLFALTTVREMFRNHRYGAATSSPWRADSWCSHRGTGSRWTADPHRRQPGDASQQLPHALGSARQHLLQLRGPLFRQKLREEGEEGEPEPLLLDLTWEPRRVRHLSAIHPSFLSPSASTSAALTARLALRLRLASLRGLCPWSPGPL